MDEKGLIDDIFKNLPEDLSREALSFMDLGTVLTLCKQNDPLNRICTENFWKQRVLKFMKSSKDGGAIFLHTQFIPREETKTGHVPTWRAMASGLYLRSLENQKQCGICFEYETDEVPLTGTCDRRSCKHVFHEDCLDKWLAINSSCPQCRRPCDNARARARRRKQRRKQRRRNV